MSSPARPIVLHRGTGRNVAIDALIGTANLTTVASDRIREVPSLITAIDPRERRAIVEQIHAAGGSIAALEIAGDAIARRTTFGEGTLVCGGALYIGSAVSIGRHTIVMTPASLGHDVVIGDFVTIHPSTSISGYVVIEDDVTIDVGAVIVNGRTEKLLRIGRGAHLAPGAVVTTSVKAGETVAGNPARPMSH